MSEKMINRGGAQSLIPEEVTKEILTGIRKQSVAMKLMKKLPNMSSKTERAPVLSMLPSADFVDGDAGMSITTEIAWDKKMLIAGKLACIVPVPNDVLEDADYDIWGEAKPLIEEAIGRKYDNQVFSKRNPKAPVEWPDPIIPAAVAKGNIIVEGTEVDIGADIGAAMAVLEDNEYDVTGIAAQKRLRSKLRNLRDNNNNPIFTPMTGDVPSSIYGTPSQFVGKGVWDRTAALAVLGDWNMACYSMRKDMTFQIFDSGVISDDNGKVIYNLIQQDMVAMRVVVRIAWQIADPVDIDRAYGSSYPFSVLK